MGGVGFKNYSRVSAENPPPQKNVLEFTLNRAKSITFDQNFTQLAVILTKNDINHQKNTLNFSLYIEQRQYCLSEYLIVCLVNTKEFASICHLNRESLDFYLGWEGIIYLDVYLGWYGKFLL